MGVIDLRVTMGETGRNKTVLMESPSEHPKDKSGLDASAKLTRAELNKRSGDADLSKDKSCPESPPEFQRSWYVEGHIRSKVISSVLAQRHLRKSLTKGKLRPGHWPKDFPIDSLPNPPAHPIPINKLSLPVKVRRPPLQEQRANPFKKVKKTGGPEHNQGESKKEKVQIQRKKRAKLPRNIRVYEGNKDPEDHLGIFSAAAKQEEWLMPVWCKMFSQTLGGATQNYFDDLDPKSVDSFEELSQKFLEEFSQQKRYAKDPTEIHDIKRRQNEGLQAFMDRFKSKSSHIKGVPPVLRISAFMHGHDHPELAKKLNDKIPKKMDEMFERVRAFIRGEVATGSAEMMRPSQGDKGYVRPAWSGVPEKAKSIGGPREARRNIGVYTLYHRKDTFTLLIKTSKEILAMESGRNGVKVINMIREEGNRKRSFEEGRFGLMSKLTFLKSSMNTTSETLISTSSQGSAGHRAPMIGEGLIRKVRHPEWITNAIPIKLANGTWKVQMDYSSLNKAYSKDMYPFPEEGEELASLMGYPYKCFLRLSKEYNQIRMAEDDEEKIGFHMEEGVYCFTHMPKELKNSVATL
ncbi:reverse transcriptase domain-containing protein [Tanacetum coccineum]